MKKIILLYSLLLFSCALIAQVSKTVNVTAGGLSSALTTTEKNTITSLYITGTIDARDFVTLRDTIKLLEILDLNEVKIVAYSGLQGTQWISWKKTYDYPANTIPASAFYNSKAKTGKLSLKSISLPTSVKTIDAQAFFLCSNLNSVIIPSSVTTIKLSSFGYCTNLDSLNIPFSITDIQRFALEGFGGQIIVDPNNSNYSSIEGVLFNKELTTLIFFPSLKTTERYSIPNTVSSIFQYAFEGCNKLKHINIPATITSIGWGAFKNCSSLDSVIIPSSISIIDEYVFGGCSSLTYVDIPISVKTIGGMAFLNCTSLKSIFIPSSVLKIRDAAFEGCTSLSSVIIPPLIKSIEYAVFASCSGLISISIPPSVNRIGNFAFADCYNLKSVSIPSAVDTISSNAFSGCLNLNSIYSHPVIPVDLTSPYSSQVFNEVNKNSCILYVPVGSKSAYQSSCQWTEFSNIIEMPDLIISKDSVKIAANEGSTIPFQVTSNTTWIASSNQSWLTVNPNTAITGNGTLIFSAEANTGVSRTATVTIVSNAEVRTIQITQAVGNITTTITNTSKEINLFPNPTTDYFSLKGIAGKALVQLYSIDGRLVMEKEVLENENFIINSLKQGIYTVRINIGDSIFVKKLMKL